MLIEDQIFWYSSLETLITQSFVIGLMYLTACEIFKKRVERSLEKKIIQRQSMEKTNEQEQPPLFILYLGKIRAKKLDHIHRS